MRQLTQNSSAYILITYLLMELSLLEELPILQLLKNFPAFYGGNSSADVLIII
jgi:hypothetical protein